MSSSVTYNHFPQVAAALPLRVSQIVRKTLFDVIAQATPNTPVDTGHLRNAISVEGPGGSPIAPGDTSGFTHWHAGYALYQEEGTRYITGHHFARDAVNAVRPGFLAAMQQLERQIT